MIVTRVSTNLTEQISTRFPGGISRKIQDMFALLQPAMQCTESTSLPKYRTKTWYAQDWAMTMIKKGDQFKNKWASTQLYHDWKPMQSDHQHFTQKFPGGFLNSSRLSVVDTLIVYGKYATCTLYRLCKCMLKHCIEWDKWVVTNYPTVDSVLTHLLHCRTSCSQWSIV